LNGSFFDIFLVSLGAIAGAWSRMYLTIRFNRIFVRQFWSTFFINIFSTFALGLFLAFHSPDLIFEDNSKLILFFSIGFFGSLSTFSTFIIDLLNSLLSRNRSEFMLFSLLTLFIGIMAFIVGFGLINN